MTLAKYRFINWKCKEMEVVKDILFYMYTDASSNQHEFMRMSPEILSYADPLTHQIQHILGFYSLVLDLSTGAGSHF